MLIKIQSFIIAIYLLIAGLSYADKTIKVECDIDFAVTEFSPGESGTFEIRCKNIGIPFKGENPHNVDYSFFKTVDGGLSQWQNVGVAVEMAIKQLFIFI